MCKCKKSLTVEERIAHLKQHKKIMFGIINEIDAANILLKYSYINLITPLKHHFAKRSERDYDVLAKRNGKNIYEYHVEFSEYYNKYMEKRSLYPIIYKNIITFESHLKAIISNTLLTHYSIDDYSALDTFISQLKLNSSSYTTRQNHLLSTFNTILNDTQNTTNIFLFFDKMELKDYSNIFHCLNDDLKKEVFNILKSFNATLGNFKICLGIAS